jgi:hypothetical protein
MALLCVPFDDNVLNDAVLLSAALRSTPLAKIPVDRFVDLGSGLADSVFEKIGNGVEARLFVNRFEAFEARCLELHGDTSEESVLACVTEITGMMWRQMTLMITGFGPVFDVRYNKRDDQTRLII